MYMSTHQNLQNRSMVGLKDIFNFFFIFPREKEKLSKGQMSAGHRNKELRTVSALEKKRTRVHIHMLDPEM